MLIRPAPILDTSGPPEPSWTCSTRFSPRLIRSCHCTLAAPRSCARRGALVDFEIPPELVSYLAELDEFIEREIRPVEARADNIRFFDYRREDARTDGARGGLPNAQWEALLREAVALADAAGHYRYAFPADYGGRDGTNLGMAIIREPLAAKGLGLHCDLQNEHMIVGN